MQVCAAGCGQPVPLLAGRGRPGVFCSSRCRLRSHRRKQLQDETKIGDSETKIEDIRFYCGLNERTWNHHPVTPGRYACVAPVYGKTRETKTVNRVFVPADVESVIVDSGAFSDTTDVRLSFEGALHRQIAHAYQFGYARQVSHLASYDLLIDEKWAGGQRIKARWSRSEAEEAVQQTVLAATYLAHQRRFLQGVFNRPVGLVLSAQGVEVEQYLRCTQQVVSYMQEGDIFGLGGWCITGLLPAVIMPSFRSILPTVIAYLGSQQVRRVHVWGVIYPDALGPLLWLCDQYGIQLSTDSSGPCRGPVFGNWGYGSWRDKTYKVPPILSSCKACDSIGVPAPTCEATAHCRGLDRIRHVQLTRQWLAHFRTYEQSCYVPIQQPQPHYQQSSLFDREGCLYE